MNECLYRTSCDCTDEECIGCDMFAPLDMEAHITGEYLSYLNECHEQLLEDIEEYK